MALTKIVLDLLTKDPLTREDDIYLIWKCWKEEFKNIESISMWKFKKMLFRGELTHPGVIVLEKVIAQSDSLDLRAHKDCPGQYMPMARREFLNQYFKDNPDLKLNKDSRVLKACIVGLCDRITPDPEELMSISHYIEVYREDLAEMSTNIFSLLNAQCRVLDPGTDGFEFPNIFNNDPFSRVYKVKIIEQSIEIVQQHVIKK